MSKATRTVTRPPSRFEPTELKQRPSKLEDRSIALKKEIVVSIKPSTFPITKSSSKAYGGVQLLVHGQPARRPNRSLSKPGLLLDLPCAVLVRARCGCCSN